MWPDTRLQKLFGIDTPIVQAPMAGASSIEMAIAVSEGGGLGSLACAAYEPAVVADALTAYRARTACPVSVNFFAHSSKTGPSDRGHRWLNRLAPYYDELGVEHPRSLYGGAISPFNEDHCDVVMSLRPEVVSFHFGLPDSALVDRMKNAGIIVMSSATTVAEADWLATHGCDVIIAQGYEAGGHRGMFLSDDICTQVGTLALIPQIVDAVGVPVIATGGIADGRGIAACFALGAAGAQLGTAFLHTEEARISPVYRTALSAVKADETTITNVISGRPTRVRSNRMVRELGPISSDAPDFPFGFAAVSRLWREAERRGTPDFSPHYCGQAAPLGRNCSTANLLENLRDQALLLMSGRRAAGAHSKAG